MPWQGMNFDWTRASIVANAPNQSGVYFIYRTGQNIYVGETNDLQRRLLEHFDGDNPCIIRAAPQTFGFELSPANARVARQNALIVEYGPTTCNQRLG